MFTGPVPSTSIYNTWLENVEITSADDGGLWDLSTATEITVRVQNPLTRLDELTLTLSNGDVTLPSLGIIQWRVEAGTMGSLPCKLYKVILTIEDDDDTNVLILGDLSLVE
jgi:hypothetical protein